MLLIVITLIVFGILATGCSKQIVPVKEEPPQQGHPRYEPDNSRHPKL